MKYSSENPPAVGAKVAAYEPGDLVRMALLNDLPPKAFLFHVTKPNETHAYVWSTYYLTYTTMDYQKMRDWPEDWETE